MKRLSRTIAVLAFTLAATSALAHGRLLTSNPKEGARLEKAPTAVRLQFNEPVEATFTTVMLLGPDGKEMTTGKAHVDKDDARTVILDVPTLAAGAYKAAWSMVGPDGHRVKGALRFSIK